MTSHRISTARRVGASVAALWMLALLAGSAVAQTASGPAAPPALLKPGQPIPPMELERFVDGVVRDAMAAEHVAGVSVAIVQDGRTVLLKGYGVSGVGSGHAVDPAKTLFRVGSISKTFTWITLMKEVERGRIRLDAPVNDYLPPRLKIPDQGFKRPIRVRDLMSHSSGLEDVELRHLFVEKPEDLMSKEDFLANDRPNRVREPGVLSSYSNYGAALAGEIVARLNGEDYETVVEREVFRPLGMADTTFREPYPPRPGLAAPMPKALAARVSTGFIWGGSGYRPYGFEYVSQDAPAGSVSTTAADMARYMRMQLAGGGLDGAQIYGAQTAQAFRTPLMDVPSGVNGWAHGFMIRPLPGGFSGYGHGGALQAFFSNMVVAPDLGLGVFATTNTSTGRGLVERLPNLIAQRFYAPEAPLSFAPPDPGLTRLADRYAGTYFTTRRTYSGLEKFVGLLKDADKVSVTRSGYLVTGSGGQAQAWVPDGAPGRFRAADGDQRLTFALDARGRAVSSPAPRGTFSLERASLVHEPALFAAAAALAFTAALATWIGAFTRIGRDVRPTAWQWRAHLLSLGVATLWLMAFAAFGLAFAGGTPPEIVYTWPGPAVLTASTAALLAALGSLALLVLTPLAWRDPAAGQGGWSLWRKGRHVLAALVFVVFASLVAAWGGLTPWA